MANKFKDLTGKTFGDLTAVRRVGSDSEGNAVWEWKCLCGSSVELNAHVVKRGHNLSCGCRKARQSARFAVENSWAEDRFAKCGKCSATKLHKEFRKQYRKGAAFPRAWCSECDNKAHKHYMRGTPEKKLAWAFRTIRYKCEQENLPFDLEFEDFLPIPKTCPALGIPMNYDGRRDFVPTFDRLIPVKGYVKGNVNIISHRANRMKSDATLSELRAVLDWMKKPLTTS